MAPIALLSVSNKEGLLPFAKALTQLHGFQLLSSGGTARLLEEEGVQVTRVSDYTGAKEILGGRVKTLHPSVHGGILAKRNDSAHLADLEEQGIKQIDLVVVNLYPFRETINNPNLGWDEAIEQIDIGGPAMVRAAAKNHADVSVLTRPEQYNFFLEALNDDKVDIGLRKRLALEAFEHTASYDTAISEWMNKSILSETNCFSKTMPLKQHLRYGENPHQSATWYSDQSKGWGSAKQLQGKELSTNNLLDLEAALSTVYEFGYGDSKINPCDQKAAVVIKHTNPCGAGISNSIHEALNKAINADPVSAFGGIVAMNCTVNGEAANLLKDRFLECIVAPQFDRDAKEILSKKIKLRILELSPESIDIKDNSTFRSILGGVLLQEKDNEIVSTNDWNVVTKASLTTEEHDELLFAWKLVKHVRSNAIVVTKAGQSLGIGAGQMNRVGSAKIALDSAGEMANGAFLASDGFFPFEDTVRLAAKHGIKAIIQPGGSLRDNESIQACDELGIAMILTGRRHFLH